MVMTALALLGTSPAIAVAATAVWGFTVGGAPTIFQTASANAAGGAVDVAQSMLVTVLNAGMAAGAWPAASRGRRAASGSHTTGRNGVDRTTSSNFVSHSRADEAEDRVRHLRAHGPPSRRSPSNGLFPHPLSRRSLRLPTATGSARPDRRRPRGPHFSPVTDGSRVVGWGDAAPLLAGLPQLLGGRRVVGQRRGRGRLALRVVPSRLLGHRGCTGEEQ